MALTIWKYELRPDDYVDLEVQIGAKVLCLQSQNNALCLWCLVDPEEDTEIRRFRIAGTGHPIEELGIERQYIGTAQLLDGTFVAHVFEIIIEG